MKRTSLTHPLQIAIVSAGPDFGRVGITFCPGKYDRHAMTGEWVRDLALDLDRVRDWGAAAVVSLLELEELVLLRVERLGEEILRRNESRKLKAGDRVQWDNSLTDRGTISAVDWRGVTIKWDDG